MFGKSYSDQSLINFISVLESLDLDHQLTLYPVKGIKPQSELTMDGLKDFFNSYKKNLAINRSLFESGIIYYLLEYYFDGKPRDKDKFLKEGIEAASSFFADKAFKTIRKNAKNPQNSFYRSGYLWGEKFHNRYLTGEPNQIDIQSEDLIASQEEEILIEDERVISVLAPSDKKFYKKGKITIENTFFVRNLSNLINQEPHVICRRGEKNLYFELFSESDISGYLDPSFEYLDYDDELKKDKVIYQFKTKDNSIPEKIELKYRKSNKDREYLIDDFEIEIDKILKKNASSFSNHRETINKSAKYSGKVDLEDPDNELNRVFILDITYGYEMLIEQVIEELITHLNNSLDSDFKIESDGKEFNGLSDLKVFHGEYCFLRRRKRSSMTDLFDYRYGWESNICEQKYFTNLFGDYEFIKKAFLNCIKYYLRGLLINPDTILNLEIVYSKYNNFVDVTKRKLMSIQKECTTYFGDFNPIFHTHLWHNNNLDYIFMLTMQDPLAKDITPIGIDLGEEINIMTMQGHMDSDESLISGISLDGDELYFTTEEDNLAYDAEIHLVEPMQNILKLKNDEKSHRDIYVELFEKKVGLYKKSTVNTFKDFVQKYK